MQQGQVESGRDDFKMFLTWMTFLARALATSVEVFLHRGFGKRYFGLQAGAALVVMFFYTAFWRTRDVRPVLWFMLAYLVAWVVARARMLFNRASGPPSHSHYTGRSWLMRFTGSMSEASVKAFVEPALVFTLSVFLMPLSEPLGGYLMLTSVGLFISTQLALGQRRMQALDLYDAHIDQQGVVEEFRDMRGE